MTESENLSENLSFFASVFQVDRNPEIGMWLLYGTILILSVIVYKLGFAKKLPVLKSAAVYFFLALGCSVLTLFGIAYPVTEGLFVAALILIIYKLRLHQSKKEEAKS